ncbi:hypothetical protein GCM10009069_27160 [Algimonas arctica]|uniref:Uncharacterized protein n=1 Tax=Algimonas arctica TaxID=1479486 RepID=A0A8J3CTB3_9PROT|nr:hypothetical protein [Algimonas arctica]GHB02952.1 hypothetical protein GCM10009069_27160 [Algimonas arctica]
MRLVINILAIIGLLISVTSLIELYALRINEGPSEGFASVAVPFWVIIGASAACVFGFIGRIIDRRKPMPASKLSDMSIAGGLLCGALLLAVPFVFG